MEELPLQRILVNAFLVIILVALNAFFVAAEFALVATRRTRIETLAREGDAKAKIVERALQDLYRQLSAAQLGITVASILLGYIAEETVAMMFLGLVHSLPPAVSFLARGGIAAVVAVSVVSFLHVVFGEQAPKAWAISYPETTSRWLSAPLIFFSWITRPATNLLNWSANKLISLLGLDTGDQHARAHRADEIVMLVRKSQESGHLAPHDVRLIEGVFDFTEKNVRDVMTPRTDVLGLPADLTIRDCLPAIAEAKRSRYPVYEESLDDIIGVVHVKQVLASLEAKGGEPVAAIARKPYFVPGTRDVEDVLADLKQIKSQMAIVLDEFGGTAGIVTMEDLLEEIVGEIYDEYDSAAEPTMVGKDGTTVPGDTDIEDVNARFGLAISDEDYQTIGGFVFGQLGRLPTAGDRVTIPGAVLEVVDMDGRRVADVKLTMATEEETEEPAE